MKTALIISGGEFNNSIPSFEYDLIIACDKGLKYANELKITPDIVLGDFDSMDISECDNIPSGNLKSTNYNGTSILTFPIEKDDTDTMLAIKHAIDLGCQHIVIVCALGGRTDHLLANIQSLHYAANNQVLCEIYSSSEHLTAYQGPCEITLPYKEGYSLSLFSLSDECCQLSIVGTKYEVSDIMLTNSFPLAYGNSIVSPSASIMLTSGTLLVIESLI